MKTLIKTLLMSLILIQTSLIEARDFGSGAEMDKLVPISKVLSAPKEYLNKDITVEGAIVAVCENQGCWLKIASDKKFQTLRIKVKDGDMVFPPNSKDKMAFATGKLKGLELTKEKAIAYLQHMADESKEIFDPASVTEGITIYQLVPKGVTIVD
jgi:hypothetical protein